MRTLAKTLSLVAALCVLAATATALSAQDIALPSPQKNGGMPLMDALAKRSTSRSFDSKRELSRQQLSNLLWAAWGLNRADGKRTAPSANNKQEIDIYVLLKQGAYRYDAKAHALVAVAAGKDIRELGGTQSFVKDAPVTLVLVANLSKLSQKTEAAKREVAAVNAGFIAQNIYLHCASEGLATGTRMNIDREKLGPAISLKNTQWAVIANSVGYAKK
ncbi:SagB-type dehydrogenase family enzyme [Ereboglobus sp. PH5-10]|uniref:SagB/ThcOx family dehydrogenase n=1 Tax=Ereboglobus sp. PH5-10 TaxID=2940629 RepID=UPI0024070958|nr:SagB/ThcOx family dehydrogenase [Ereboglobus sp. PH5-10]MDF9828014.1 SagB-type dehydrogenase family enzyme [Ereboglobus sp. PH5-10]